MEIQVLKYLTLLVGFYMAWNIGANDVANAMGTSVGSKALTLRRAVVLAAILEFSGAFFVGSNVSETIQSGIVDPNIFAHDPMIFVIGMMGSLFATGVWLQLASFLGLPVSTTHAIVGAVLGFGAVIGGVHAVHWIEIGQIALSWVLSPLLSGSISYILFRIVQRKIFFSLHPVQQAKKFAPILVFLCISVAFLSILYDGLKNLHLDFNFPTALLYSILLGVLAFFISSQLLRRVEEPSLVVPDKDRETPQQVISLGKAIKHLRRVKLSASEETKERAGKILEEVKSLTEKVRQKTQAHEVATPFSSVEKTFVYLQILSASLVAFAHGANDVANAIGPVSAVIQVLHTGTLEATTQIPYWLLLLGGAGIVLGLATWGWRVIETIGRKITELTPTRGFCAEFGAALTILLASKLGMPISTTHALVGSVLGVGLARGLQALNLRTLRDIAASWVLTIPICAILSILIFYLLRWVTDIF